MRRSFRSTVASPSAGKLTELRPLVALPGAEFLAEIDWARPWLAGLTEAAAPILRSTSWREALNDAARGMGLRNHLGKPIHFVPQASLPPGMAYEAFISASGGVPTRSNLHDFFNALVWLTFPRIKVQLNALQAAEIARAASCHQTPALGGRGRVRDAATLFDENAAILVVRDAGMLEALRAHRWTEAFLTRRNAFGRVCEVWLFGHALMEKLIHPYKAITAHTWPVMADAPFFELSKRDKIAWIDETVAKQLSAGLTTAGFTPLPVLGVPGWWDGQDAAFYEDASVFRPLRKPGK